MGVDDEGGISVGFDVMFNLFPVLFLLVVGFIVFVLVRNVGEWSRNNSSPVTTAEVVAVGKRLQSDAHMHGDGVHHHTTVYFATFEFGSGERLEFRMPAREYGLLAERDRGILTYQGSRFVNFERK